MAGGVRRRNLVHHRMDHNTEWVDATHGVTSTTYSRQVPLGEGERFMTVAAGTRSELVKGSFLCYPAKNTSGKMYSHLFLR